MTIKEAYEKWGQQDQNKTLAIKTKVSWQKVWAKLDMEKDCAQITLKLLRELIKDNTDKMAVIRASSVMCHVLKFANSIDSNNPTPSFEYSDIIRTENKKDIKMERELCKPERNVPKSERNVPKPERNVPDSEKPAKKTPPKKTPNKSRERRKVAQIDMSTMEVVRIWPTLKEPQHELGVSSIWRAIERRRPAGGYYWCDVKDIETFEPTPYQGNRGSTQKEKTVTMSKEVKARLEEMEAAEKKKRQAAPVSTSASLNPALKDFTDSELINELKSRGWRGCIHLNTNVYL